MQQKLGMFHGQVRVTHLFMLRLRIVVVQNNYNGLMVLFDSDNYNFEGTPGLSKNMLRKAPNSKKTCYLLQTNLKIPYFMCD
jgi:hypothetical protein